MLTKDCIVFDHLERKLFVFSSPFLTYDTDPATEYRRCAAHIADTHRPRSRRSTKRQKRRDTAQTINKTSRKCPGNLPQSRTTPAAKRSRMRSKRSKSISWPGIFSRPFSRGEWNVRLHRTRSPSTRRCGQSTRARTCITLISGTSR